MAIAGAIHGKEHRGRVYRTTRATRNNFHRCRRKLRQGLHGSGRERRHNLHRSGCELSIGSGDHHAKEIAGGTGSSRNRPDSISWCCLLFLDRGGLPTLLVTLLLPAFGGLVPRDSAVVALPGKFRSLSLDLSLVFAFPSALVTLSVLASIEASAAGFAERTA